MTDEWDAAAYASLELPHEQWGRRVLAGLPLRGDETVLDAGCGTGRDTLAVLGRLPRGRVVAVDGSLRMLEQARAALREAAVDDARVAFVQADLGRPLPVARVDAAFSVATFHWVPDHAALFAALADVLRPGGELRAEWGGRGNIASVTRAITEVTGVGGDDWEFADAESTEKRLLAAGFVDVRARLRAAPFRLADARAQDFLRTVVLGRVFAAVEPDGREDTVRRILEALPEPVLDYVRLEVSARRGPG